MNITAERERVRAAVKGKLKAEKERLFLTINNFQLFSSFVKISPTYAPKEKQQRFVSE